VGSAKCLMLAPPLARSSVTKLSTNLLTNLMPRYQVTPELMAHAKPTAKFMHCMPIRRGEEVVDEVVESKQSIIFDQAEYRMHTAAALLCHVLAAKS